MITAICVFHRAIQSLEVELATEMAISLSLEEEIDRLTAFEDDDEDEVSRAQRDSRLCSLRAKLALSRLILVVFVRLVQRLWILILIIVIIICIFPYPCDLSLIDVSAVVVQRRALLEEFDERYFLCFFFSNFHKFRWFRMKNCHLEDRFDAVIVAGQHLRELFEIGANDMNASVRIGDVRFPAIAVAHPAAIGRDGERKNGLEKLREYIADVSTKLSDRLTVANQQPELFVASE